MKWNISRMLLLLFLIVFTGIGSVPAAEFTTSSLKKQEARAPLSTSQNSEQYSARIEGIAAIDSAEQRNEDLISTTMEFTPLPESRTVILIGAALLAAGLYGRKKLKK